MSFDQFIENKIKNERDYDELIYFSILKQMRSILTSYSHQQMTIKQSDDDFKNLINLETKIGSLMDFHLQDRHIKDYLLIAITMKKITLEEIQQGLSKCQDRQKFIDLFKQLISLLI